MRYGKISEAIWTDDKFSLLSDTAKLLFIYLLSCSKCNSVGVFPMGLGAIEDEFGHDRQEIRAAIAELEQQGLARYTDGWFFFNRFLKWNAPVSPNHARQIATVLNDCVMQNAPAAAVCSVLGSVRGSLAVMTYKSKDGRTCSYWDDFKSALDCDGVTAYLGGEEAFKSCLKGESCAAGSTSRGLPKGSGNIFRNKYSDSTDEVLPKDLATQTRNKQETETYKTRQDKTRSSLDLACNNARENVSLFCSDGEVRNVSSKTVDAVASSHPEWDMHILCIKLQILTSQQEESRPDPDDLDEFFLEMSVYFNGDTLKVPQNRFSARKGEITTPDETNALAEVSGAYAEG